MNNSDITGAKASNAGDDFHILWTLRHALRVLDPMSNLIAVTVEGLPSKDTVAAEKGAWEGVDVGLFYGGQTLTSASHVEIQQLKYSTTSPDLAWTIARLCYSSRKTGNNSVIARLAKAFIEVMRLAPELTLANITVKLVSNQPIHKNVVDAIKAHSPGSARKRTSRTLVAWEKLRQASGLKAATFTEFAKALDFSECQGPSRFEVQRRIVAAIAEVAASDSRLVMLELRNVVYSRMLPGSAPPITRETVLGAMFVGDPQALLPCPSHIKQVTSVISREVVAEILLQQSPQQQRLCLHGEGGCGKTTVLQELKARLPNGSEMIIFDCYGGGRYLDSDGQRHLPRHAFLHLCNEVSVRVGAPMLIVASSLVDYAREFSLRLRRASAIIEARSDDALLIIAIDAADNSVTAAQTRVPLEHSFVYDLTELGELPPNVRLLISARTGRLEELELRDSFKKIQIGDFKLPETTEFVRLHWKTAPRAWIEDLQFLSGGNPRVISYAFEYAKDKPADALNYLRPSGKDLKLIFGERVKEALRKNGDALEFRRLCAALVALARPIPVKHIADVLKVSEAQVRDLCNDLTPGLQEDAGLLGFSDEDFEAFILAHADRSLYKIRATVAEFLLTNHQTDPYCAEHVAAALLVAGDGSRLLELVWQYPEPKAIHDPVRRREVQLHRLKLAMRVARQSGQRPDAILVLLRGAHALKTDAAVRKMLTDNIDLSSRFAQRSLRKSVLFDKDYVGLHGRALCHIMLDCALKGDAVRARDWGRQFNAWLPNYFNSRDKKTDIHDWKLDGSDIAAQGEAIFRILGAYQGVKSLRRWKPKTMMPAVITSIGHRLLASGQHLVVESILGELLRKPLWDVLIRVPLALSGHGTDLKFLERNIGRWVRRGWLTQEAAHHDLTQPGRNTTVVECLLIAAEIVAAQKGIVPEVRLVLEIFATPSWRQRDKLYAGAYELVDASLRAHALLEREAGRSATLESYLQPEEQALPEAIMCGEERQKKKSRDERLEQLEKFIRDLLPIYDARAACLLPSLNRQIEIERLEAVLNRYGHGNYGRRDVHDTAAIRDRIAGSIAAMLHLPEVSVEKLAMMAYHFAGVREGWLSNRELSMLQALSLHGGTHLFVLAKTVAHAKAILIERAPATERANQMIGLARLVSTFSPNDGESLFATATAMLENVDVDSVFQLNMLEAFVKPTACVLDQQSRRKVACQIADVTAQIWTYLGDNDRFPWESIIRSLTYLDPSVALAAISRWDDSGMIRAHRLIPDFIATGLETRAIDGTLAIPLLCLGVNIDSNVLGPIDAHIKTVNAIPERSAIAEELMRLVLLNVDGHHGMSEVRMALDMAVHNQSTRWVVCARDVLRFFDETIVKVEDGSEKPGMESTPDKQTKQIRAVVTGFGRNYVTQAEIEETVTEIMVAARRAKEYISVGAVLEEMRHVVLPMNRRAHLEALDKSVLGHSHYEQASAISAAVKEWASLSPSVASWCSERLPLLLAEQLPFFFRSPYSWQSPLPDLLAASGLDADQICESLLEGLESNASEWDATSVYSMLEIVALYLTPGEAADVLTKHLTQEAREASTQQVLFDPLDIPSTTEVSLGRMLYALLGDADLRVRWVAAHGMRAAARLGRQSVVDSAFEQWHRKQDSSFRDPLAPFYWLAARLWLLIAADRIAWETPTALSKHGHFLFNTAIDVTFPHVLCRHFAKDAALVLIQNGNLQLRNKERMLLECVNTTRLALKRKPNSIGRGFGGFHEMEKRRFCFDSMDTLPYWYSEPLRLFADVGSKEFLDVAESWIIDEWHGDVEVWQWANEPRKDRFAHDPYASSHRQGSLPTIERAHTHLEWHAMWCTVGKLLETRPLAKAEDGSFETWDYWLSHIGLTQAPLWLSDIRTHKPLDARLWYSDTRQDDEWLKQVDASNLLEELDLVHPSGEVIVASHVIQYEGKRRSTIYISSALVATETASALLRALQTIGNTWNYKIPEEGEHMEIDEAPYCLLGWLRHSERDGNLDDNDKMRRQVGVCSARPGPEVINVLALREDPSDSLRWIGANAEVNFRYVAWSDDMSDGISHTSPGFPRSYGHRLMASTAAIQRYLQTKKMDLIIEVTLTRRTKENYADDDSQEPTETQCDRVLVFRQDGSIEHADGRVGTWTVPGTRTRPGRERRYTG